MDQGTEVITVKRKTVATGLWVLFVILCAVIGSLIGIQLALLFGW